MSFTAKITQTVYASSRRIVYGTYANDGGSTGGEVLTGLQAVEACFLQPWSNAVVANQPAVNESFDPPLVNANGSVTIVTTANESGSFVAYGI